MEAEGEGVEPAAAAPLPAPDTGVPAAPPLDPGVRELAATATEPFFGVNVDESGAGGRLCGWSVGARASGGGSAHRAADREMAVCTWSCIKTHKQEII